MIDDYLWSCSSSVAIESCTSRGPWPLPEAEPSQLASLALSGIHRNNGTPVKESTKSSEIEGKLNPRMSPLDPRNSIPHYKI